MTAKAVVTQIIQKEINYQKSVGIRIANLLITNPRAVKIATNCLVEKYSSI